MSGQTIILGGLRQRDLAKRLIEAAPVNAVVKVSAPRRTVDQNALMWAKLSDVSRAKPEGREHTTDVWKALFLHALGHSVSFEMALDGRGMVPVEFRSSRLTKDQMSDLIEIINEYGARHGIRWTDETKQAA